jgi:molecular chaperone GrpE
MQSLRNLKSEKQNEKPSETKAEEVNEPKNDSPQTESPNNSLEEENKKLKETLMRTLAELENTRRRSAEENEKTAKFAIGKFAEDLIGVMESFHLAFNSIKDPSLIDKGFYEGIQLTQNELKKAFEKHGLTRIYPLKENFNPEIHNAIAQIESELEEGKIVEVMQAGYTINGRLLRPALVAVSKNKS